MTTQFILQTLEKESSFALERISEFEVILHLDHRKLCFHILQNTSSEMVLRDESGQTHCVRLWQKQNQIFAHAHKEHFSFHLLDERAQRHQKALGHHDHNIGQILAPMPGRIVKVEVSVGQAVQKGQGLIVVEAMKMENEYKAPKDGVIKAILVEPGMAIEAKTVLLEME